MKKYFSSYQSLTRNDFEQIEKAKEYQKYLKRIEQIVHKKPQQDISPSKYMKAQRQFKQNVHRLAKSQQQSRLTNQNNLLVDRILSHKNRKIKPIDPYYSIRCDFPRRKEMQRIDMENQSLATRLAERYSHKKSESQFQPKNQMKKSRYVETRLPELVVMTTPKTPE